MELLYLFIGLIIGRFIGMWKEFEAVQEVEEGTWQIINANNDTIYDLIQEVLDLNQKLIDQNDKAA